MNSEMFGDSYDIVKQSLLRWLKGKGKWAVFPMFTDDNPGQYAEEYFYLLGLPSAPAVRFNRSENPNWIAEPMRCQHHLFIDPDTGVREEFPKSSGDPNNYLLLHELAQIANADGRKKRLTLVFDQSIERDEPGVKAADASQEQLRKKLDWLKDSRVHGVAYRSHANFLLLSENEDLVRQAVATIRKESRLPASRFVWPTSGGV